MGDLQESDQERETASFVRLPGLQRGWEIEQLLEPGCVLHIEEAGQAEDGTPLFAVYRREESPR